MNDEDEDTASETERAEAEALARALDGDAGVEAPEDALQAALFLRHGGARGELAPDRAEEILQDLLGDAPSATERAAPPWIEPRRRSRALQLSAAVVMLAAAAVMFYLLPASDAPWRHPLRTCAPSCPPRARACSRRRPICCARAPRPARRTPPRRSSFFDRELRAYRAQLMQALQAAYPAPVGTLEPQRRSR